jgi:hypothetical protein
MSVMPFSTGWHQPSATLMRCSRAATSLCPPDTLCLHPPVTFETLLPKTLVATALFQYLTGVRWALRCCDR